MKITTFVFPTLLSLVCLLTQRPAALATQADILNISYSSLVPSEAPFWIAQDLKLFEKEK